MFNKKAFQVWTPARAWAWTRFAKAALFQNEQAFAPSDDSRAYAGQLIGTELPFDLQAYDYRNTVVIIDLPGVESIQYGLKLYMQTGLQPIPMFNAVVGADNGGRKDVVDNSGIIKALASGTYVLATGSPSQSNDLRESVGASFLLDYDRDSSITYGTDVYDNRWNVIANDLPDSEYLTGAKIKKVLYLTQGTPHNDIAEILSAYQRNGIQVQIYQCATKTSFGYSDYDQKEGTGQFSDWNWDNLELKGLGSIPTPDVPTASMLVARAHPSRKMFSWIFGIIALLSVINAFVQWTVGRPLFWTVPGAQWLIYAIVPETIGDVFLILFTIFNIGIWMAIKAGNDKAIRIGWYAFLVDAIWFLIYVFTYVAPADAWNVGQRGLMAFAETPAYALFALGLPLALGLVLFANYRIYRKFISSPTPPGWYAGTPESPEHRYWNGNSWDERLRYQAENGQAFTYYTMANRPVIIATAQRPRIYGYSGYGGTGRGGYGGGAYRGGYGGGHGG